MKTSSLCLILHWHYATPHSMRQVRIPSLVVGITTTVGFTWFNQTVSYICYEGWMHWDYSVNKIKLFKDYARTRYFCLLSACCERDMGTLFDLIIFIFWCFPFSIINFYCMFACLSQVSLMFRCFWNECRHGKKWYRAKKSLYCKNKDRVTLYM